jgi:mannose-6-phosphate isomerase-like protein (cupin superfamily)
MAHSQLASTFMVIGPDLACTPVQVTPALYGELDARFEGFKSCLLVAEYTFSEDWPTWEIHPHGDELLYLLEGECSIHLRVDGVEDILPFRRPGSVLKVPRGAWHTAKVPKSCRILFITPGEGTENVAEPPSSQG